jgi:uncharacterized protein involved in outer membrane biogenesis
MAQKSKMRKAVRPAIYIALGIVVLFLLAAIAIRIFFPNEKARAMIVEEMSKRLGHPVTIEAVSVGFYPDAEIVAKKISIADAETSNKLAFIHKIRLDPDLWQMFKGKYIIESISMNSPSISITRDADGSWKLPGLIMASTPKEADPGKQNGSLVIGDIRIRNGNLRFRDEASGFEAIAKRINGTVDPQNDEIYLDSASAFFPGIEIEISGEVSRFSRPDRTFKAAASGHLAKSGPFENITFFEPQKDDVLVYFSIDASGSAAALSLDTDLSATPSALSGSSLKADITGTLQAIDGTLAIDSLRAYWGQSSVSLAGSCSDLWSDNRSARLEGTTDIAAGDFAPMLDAEGNAAAKIAAAASMDKIDLQTNIDLTQTAFTIPRLARKESNTESSLIANGRFVIPNELVIDSFKFTIADAQINGSGRLNSATEPWARTSISTSGFPLKLLDRLPSVGFENGSLDFSTEVQKKDRNEKEIEYGGEATIHHALLSIKNVSESLQLYSVDIDFETDKVNITCDSAVFAESKCSFDAEITEFARPYIVGRLRADTIDLDKISGAFSGSGGAAQTEDELAEFESKFSAEILIDADSLKAGKLCSDALKTTMIAMDGSFAFENLEANIFEGSVSGSARLDPSPQGLRWATEFEGQDMRLEAISRAFQEGEPKYLGALSAGGALGGLAASRVEDTLGSMEGELQITVTDGEIREYLFLKNIIMLTQFSPTTLLVPGVREVTLLNTAIDVVKTRGRSLDPTCIRCTKIEGNFQIENGVAHTEDLRLESGLANLLFKGDVDLGKSQLDMRVRATPMGSIGSLMGKVPVAGKTLEKGKETVLSTDFIARGPISDPEVKLAVVEKVTRGKEENPK